MVFSDEHGEAQVYFNPGLGFFFDRLGVGPNLNGGCELRDVTDLGYADITAIARYPYQKVTDPDKASNTIRKVVRHRFSKTLVCVPKGPVPPIENSFAFICTATVTDITGARVAGEKVCFTAGGPGSEALVAFPLGTPHTREGNLLCIVTNVQGQASVEVVGKCGAGNVIAFFPEEGLIRVATFTFGCDTTTTTTTTTTGTTTTSTTTTGTTTTDRTTTPSTTTGPATTTTPAPATTTTVATVAGPQTTSTGASTTTLAATTTRAATTRRTTTARRTTTSRVRDVCPNIKGKQAKVPRGKVKVRGKCVLKPKRVVKAAKKSKRGCVVNGRYVFPCVRGKG
jgi:hypothetical protein